MHRPRSLFNGELDRNRVVQELSKEERMAGDINHSMEDVFRKSRSDVNRGFPTLRDEVKV
jgi:hypothetical protein